ncbi:MAG: GntR family transcriptional regulator [Gemmobacter sp.]|jgi:GntR family transcriptional regulator|nr:GntR family transcriptional regulator [Gemmobacter sp.]
MTKDDRPIPDALQPIVAAVDRASPIPVSVQLRGALEFGIAAGELPPGTQLPSVRDMARLFGLSPVTVSGVYVALREAGLIDSRVGSGSFVADGQGSAPQLQPHRDLQRRIAELIRLGGELGLTPHELAARVAGGGRLAGSRRGLRVLVVSNFHGPTETYAEVLRAYVAPGDTVLAGTFQELRDVGPAGADLIVTPRNFVADVLRDAQGLPVVGLTFIPTEGTRVALASLEPDARVVAVSYFPHFLPLMKAGITRFAPHVADPHVLVRDDPALTQELSGADVVIYASGADYIAAGLRPGQRAFEYLHTPDPRAIREDFEPALEARRADLQSFPRDTDEHQRRKLV